MVRRRMCESATGRPGHAAGPRPFRILRGAGHRRCVRRGHGRRARPARGRARTLAGGPRAPARRHRGGAGQAPAPPRPRALAGGGRLRGRAGPAGRGAGPAHRCPHQPRARDGGRAAPAAGHLGRRRSGGVGGRSDRCARRGRRAAGLAGRGRGADRGLDRASRCPGARRRPRPRAGRAVAVGARVAGPRVGRGGGVRPRAPACDGWPIWPSGRSSWWRRAAWSRS